MGLWGVALEMFRASPLVGQGFHTFGQHHAGFLAAGPAPSPAAGAPRDLVEIPWPHSLYLEALAEGGLAGLAGLLAPCLGIAFVLRRSWRHGTEAERRVAAALVAALLAFLAEGAVELTWHKDWVLLVFWLLAALAARLPVLGPPAASGAVAGGGAGPARPG
jgi:O-antigen ligase